MDVTQFFRRILPALLMASSVTVLSAGVFNWAPPDAIGQAAFAPPTPDSGNPILGMTPLPTPRAQPTPSPTDIPIPTGGIFTGPPYNYPVPTWPAPTATLPSTTDN